MNEDLCPDTQEAYARAIKSLDIFPKKSPIDWKKATRVLDTILAIWLEFPDLRLGQLLDSAVRRMKVGGPDLFNIEDEELLDALRKMKE